MITRPTLSKAPSTHLAHGPNQPFLLQDVRAERAKKTAATEEERKEAVQAQAQAAAQLTAEASMKADESRRVQEAARTRMEALALKETAVRRERASLAAARASIKLALTTPEKHGGDDSDEGGDSQADSDGRRSPEEDFNAKIADLSASGKFAQIAKLQKQKQARQDSRKKKK
jgi:hypothetical protein